MDPDRLNPPSAKRFIPGSLLAAVAFGVAFWLTSRIPAEAGQAFWLGYSKGRLAILAVIALQVLILGALAGLAAWKWNFLAARFNLLQWYFYAPPGLLLCLGGVLFSLAEAGPRYSPYLVRLLPLTAAWSLAAGQFWFLSRLWPTGENRLRQGIQAQAAFWLWAGGWLALLVFSLQTGYGLVEQTPFWNGPGVPVTSAQLAMVLGVLMLAGMLAARSARLAGLLQSRVFSLLAPVAVYLAAVLVWGKTPLDRHIFALQAISPNFQPFPFSDARAYDLGALSILYGDGIYFHAYMDKPLHMVLLAIFHLLAGNDYVLIQWLQVFLMAMMPVAAYSLSKRVAGPGLGLLLSALIVLQQRNAILLALRISTINIKLMATEVFTLLGMALVLAVFFAWNQARDQWRAFLAGALIGAVGLIRMNPLLLFPVFGAWIVIFCWKSRRQMVTQLMFFACGFSLVLAPWIITGTNPAGQPWFLIKIANVYDVRIAPLLRVPAPESYQPQSSLSLVAARQPGSHQRRTADVSQGSSGLGQVGGQIVRHFVHNVLTSFLALPDSYLDETIWMISLRPYWKSDDTWPGDFPARQTVAIFINSLLVALGLAWAWRRHGWGGLIPACGFLTYALALSVSLTSGGRYLVPINWILFFYYAIGILAALNWFFSALGLPLAKNVLTRLEPAPLPGRLPGWPVLVGMTLLAALIPIANVLMPVVIAQPGLSPSQTALVAQPGSQLLTGRLLYPYYENDTLTFDLYQSARPTENLPAHVDSFGLPYPLKPSMTTWLESGEFVILRMDEAQQLQAIYTLRNGDMQTYWSANQ